ncbi:hypothetical protein ABZ568_41605 [Streptomyces olindensis]|uniref:Uncharacterized protein n=1 Tax=Streptomyces olindensis TaxID=358823 RepID=A0ABV2Y9A3_9ACTN
MKLGKALAIGVAEEQPQVRDEEVELTDLPDLQDVEETAPEEVPVAR